MITPITNTKISVTGNNDAVTNVVIGNGQYRNARYQ
jgi:hypothetical protein